MGKFIEGLSTTAKAAMAVFAVITTTVGAVYAFDNKLDSKLEVYATDIEVVALADSLKELAGMYKHDKNIQRWRDIQTKMWDYEDRYGGIDVPNAPKEIKDRYRELKLEKEQLDMLMKVQQVS